MVERYLSLKPDEQRDILKAASRRLGQSEALLEKDIWICQVLQTLFSIPDHHPMAFKGGTSLSKVYGVIDRFSEDVDITLDYRSFDDGIDPFADGISGNQNRKFSEHLKNCVRNYAERVVVPALREMAEALAASGRYEIRMDDDGEKIWFGYPSAVERRNDYLESEVLVELGGRNVIDPNERHDIAPIIAPLTKYLDYPVACVTVLSPARTFWEKATLIHVACNRKKLHDDTERLSRHWYDIMKLAGHEIGKSAISNRTLMEDVVRHKKVFFNASYAKYDDCLDGRLRLVPDGDGLRGLKADYEAMKFNKMLTSDSPEFETMIDRIREIETEINNWP